MRLLKKPFLRLKTMVTDRHIFVCPISSPWKHIYLQAFNSFSSSVNSFTVFRYAASQTSSIETPLTFATTQATCPIEHGSFLPFTALPSTNFSGLTVAGP